MDKSCPDIVRQSPFIDCREDWALRLPEVHLTESWSERLCQCSVSFHWQWSIKCQDFDSVSTCPVSQVPTWDASCLTPRLSQWPILGQMFVCRVCVPGCPSTWYNRTPESRALIHTNRVIQMANLISDSQPRSDPRRWYGFSRRICSAECREERIYLSVVNESSHG